MKQLFFISLIVVPFSAFSQNEVRPEGDKLLWIFAILIAIPLVYYLFLSKRLKRKNTSVKPGFRIGRNLKIELVKDKKYRPRVLTLRVLNKSKSDVDLEAPVLHFRKFWSKRKFKLKGIDRYEIYPLYLEAGKTHELRIDLSVFFNYDRKLKRFYWAKVRVVDKKGRTYSSRFITLRKSLFS